MLTWEQLRLTVAYFHSVREHSLCSLRAKALGWNVLHEFSSWLQARRFLCHLYPSAVPGLPVDAGIHLSVKGGLIFQGKGLAKHTLRAIVGFLSARHPEDLCGREN